MLSEAIFHTVLDTKSGEQTILKTLQEMRNQLISTNIHGCTVVQNDVVLHLFQGSFLDLVLIRDFLNSQENVVSFTEVSREEIPAVEFAAWELYCAGNELSENDFEAERISKADYRKRYIDNVNRAFTTYHQVASVILRKRMLSI